MIFLIALSSTGRFQEGVRGEERVSSPHQVDRNLNVFFFLFKEKDYMNVNVYNEVYTIHCIVSLKK